MDTHIKNSTRLIVESIEKQSKAELEGLLSLSEKQNITKDSDIEREIKGKYSEALEYELEKQKREFNGNTSLLEAKHRAYLSSLRKETTERVFDAVREKLVDFTHSEGYALFLKDSLQNILNAYNEKCEIHTRKADVDLIKDFVNSENPQHEIIIDDSIVLGGLTVKLTKSYIIIDDTLDNRLTEEKDKFLKNSGLGLR